MIAGTAITVPLCERRRVSEGLIEVLPREVWQSLKIVPLLAQHVAGEQPEGRKGVDEAHCRWMRAVCRLYIPGYISSLDHWGLELPRTCTLVYTRIQGI